MNAQFSNPSLKGFMRKFLMVVVAGIGIHLCAIAQPTMTFQMPAGDAPCEGDTFCMDVTVKDFTDILSTEFLIQWDSSVLQFQEITGLNASVVDLDLADFDLSRIINGEIGFAWNDNAATCGMPTATGVTLADDVVLYQVCFSVLGSYGQGTTVSIPETPTPMVLRVNTGCANIGLFHEPALFSSCVRPFTINVSKETANPGDLVCVDFSVEGFDGMRSAQFSVNWDANLLEIANVIPGDDIENLSLGNFGTTTPGTMSVSWSFLIPNQPGFTAPDGTQFFQVCYNVLADCDETALIEFSETPTPFEFTNDDQEGFSLFFNPTEGEVATGDCDPTGLQIAANCGGAVNITDQFCVSVTAGDNFQDVTQMAFLMEWNPNIVEYTNVNTTVGGLNVNDFNEQNISNGILGVNWDVSPLPPQTVANGSELFEVCFEVVGLGGNSPFKISEPWIGRVNGSSIGINPSNCEIEVVQPPGVVMDLMDASAGPFQQAGDDQACVEVVVSNFTDILEYQFSLNWDFNVMEFGEIRNISYPEPQPDDFGGFAGVESGALFFDWEPSQSYTLPDGTALFEVCFKMLGEPGDCDELSVVELPLVSEAISSSSNGENIGISASSAEVCTLFPEGFGLDFGLTEGDRKDTTCVEMTVISFDGITAANFNISWDPTSLDFVEYNNPGTWDDLVDANFTDNSEVGILNIDWSSAGGVTLDDGTVVLELCFALIGEANDCYPITVVEDPPPPVSTINGNGSMVVTAGEICINDKFIILDTIITPASCPNASDGSVELVIEGGQGFVGTTWLTQPQQFTPLTAVNLPPGPVTFRLFDQANPALIQEFTIEIPVAGELPVAIAGVDQVLNCETNLSLLSGQGSDPETHSYRWFQVSNGLKVNIPGGDVQQFFASSTGTYILDVSNNTTGCVVSDTVVVLSPELPTADAGTDLEFNCLNETITIGGNGSTMGDTITYLWETLDTGLVVQGQETLLNPAIAAPGTYQLTVMNSETGCESTDTVKVSDERIFPTARVLPEEIELPCDGSLVTLDGSASVFDNENAGLTVTYHWEAEGATIGNGLTFQTDRLGTYTLVATEENGGCESTAIGIVVPNSEAPDVLVDDANPLTCAVDTVTLNATIGPDDINFTFQWTPLDGGQLVAGTEVGLTPQAIRPGRFVLTATNTANSCTANDTAFVMIDTIPPLAEAGPGFTLDCDNTVFTLDGTGSSTGDTIAHAWFFPDLNTAIAEDTLMVEISSAGMYYMQTTNTINGCTAVDSVQIDVEGIPPTPVLIPEQFLTCETEVLTVEATIDPPGDYDINWQIIGSGGNIIGATTGSATIQVDEVGTYQIQLTDRVTGCTSENEVIVGLDVAEPTAEAGSAESITCTRTAVTLDGTGSSTGEPFVYEWMTVSGRSDTLITEANTPGTYFLTVSNIRNGCTAMDSVTVEIDTIAPVVAIADPELINCDRSCVTLDANGTMPNLNLTAVWTGLDGGTPTPAEGLQTEVCDPGMYQVMVTSNGNGCSSTGTVEVLADETAPTIQFIQPEPFSCLVESLAVDASATGTVSDFRSITWTSLNAENSVSPATGQLNVDVTGPGDYELTVILNSTGCPSTQIINVPADNNSPVASAGDDFTLECGETSSLDGTGSSVGANFTYNWTLLEGDVMPTPNTSMEPMISGPGVFQLLVTNVDNGCTATDEVSVDLELPEAANAGTAQFICNDEAVLTANLPAGTTGRWTNMSNGTLSATDQAEVTASNLSEGANTFIWTLSAPGTCTDYSESTVTVTVETAPIANNDVLEIGKETRVGTINLRANDNLTFVSDYSVTLLNDPELGVVESISPEGDLVFNAFTGAAGETTIEYEICNTLCPDKCDTGLLTIFIEFDKEPEVANTITPNGDGVNDAFVFDKLLFSKPDQFPDNELIIFNRWGDIVFQTKPYNNDWQGQNESGQDLPQGTYYYILRLDISNGEIIRGDVTIVK